MEKIVHLNHLRNEKLILLLNAEIHQTHFLNEIVNYTYSLSLKSFLLSLTERSETHARCIDLILSELGESDYLQLNPAFKAIIRESKKVFLKCLDPELGEAGLISSLQNLKHYFISGYGTTSAYSKVLGDVQIHELLQTMWEEEVKFDGILAGFAEENLYENVK